MRKIEMPITRKGLEKIVMITLGVFGISSLYLISIYAFLDRSIVGMMVNG